MKKFFITALALGGIFSAEALAQNYYAAGYYAPQQSYAPNAGQQYYAQQPYVQNVGQQYFAGSNYYAPPPPVKKKQREIGGISVGADYVLGYASYKTVDFVVDSALTDGQDFVSDTKDLDRVFNSLSFNIGWRPLRYVGIEAFYLNSLNEKKVKYTESYTHYPEFARGEYDVSYKVYGLDLLGYVPINDYIEFIASVGVGKYDAEAKVKITAYEDNSYKELKSSSKTFEDSAMAYRIGAGAQIWLSKHLTFRVVARWTQISGDFVNYITEVNAGVRYHF